MRLIDADKIGLSDFEIFMCGGSYLEALKMLLDKIEKAPTVDITEELEKIKTEINEEDEKSIYYECDEWIEGRPCDEDYFYGLKRAIMIIDNHIFELKGEQE